MATPAPIPVNNLRRAAGEIIAHLQGIPQFAKEKVAVVGGMAVMEYIPDRTTKDIDLLVTMEDAKTRLLALPNTPFRDEPMGLRYIPVWEPRGVRVDLMHESQFPYIPEAAAAINTVQAGALPYISALDLMVLTVFSCGLYYLRFKRKEAARDVEILSQLLYNPGPPPVLTAEQRDAARNGLIALAANSDHSVIWWRLRLRI